MVQEHFFSSHNYINNWIMIKLYGTDDNFKEYDDRW